MEKRAKIVVVTGASSGIGYQAALDFARSGAVVIGVGRDAQRCEAARQRILADTPSANVTFLVADLAHQKQGTGTGRGKSANSWMSALEANWMCW